MILSGKTDNSALWDSISLYLSNSVLNTSKARLVLVMWVGSNDNRVLWFGVKSGLACNRVSSSLAPDKKVC